MSIGDVPPDDFVGRGVTRRFDNESTVFMERK